MLPVYGCSIGVIDCDVPTFKICDNYSSLLKPELFLITLFPLVFPNALTPFVPNPFRVQTISGQVGLVEAFATHGNVPPITNRVSASARPASPDITRETVEKQQRKLHENLLHTKTDLDHGHSRKGLYTPRPHQFSRSFSFRLHFPTDREATQQQLSFYFTQKNGCHFSKSHCAAPRWCSVCCLPACLLHLANRPLGLARVTPSLRRSFTRLPTLTTTVSLL